MSPIALRKHPAPQTWSANNGLEPTHFLHAVDFLVRKPYSRILFLESLGYGRYVSLLEFPERVDAITVSMRNVTNVSCASIYRGQRVGTSIFCFGNDFKMCLSICFPIQAEEPCSKVLGCFNYPGWIAGPKPGTGFVRQEMRVSGPQSDSGSECLQSSSVRTCPYQLIKILGWVGCEVCPIIDEGERPIQGYPRIPYPSKEIQMPFKDHVRLWAILTRASP